MTLKKIGLIGLKHMGCEHYSNLIELAEEKKLIIGALCDNDEECLRIPSIENSLPQINLLLKDRKNISQTELLNLLHQKMQIVCKDKKPEVYFDYKQMINEADLDGVLIVTPNHLHRKMAVYALEKGVNVLCEKPFAPTLEDCDAIIEAEKKSSAFLEIGLHYRYRKLSHFVKEAIDSKKIGDLKMMWVQEFRGDWNPNGTVVEDCKGVSDNWRYLQNASGGSILEKMCHDLDVFSWWAGAKPVKVGGTGGNAVFKDRETIDHADYFVEYENGVKLNLSLCMFAPNKRFKGRYMGIIGDKGILDFDSHEGGCEIYYHDGRTEHVNGIDPETLPGHHAGNGTMLELLDFINCMEKEKKPSANAEIGKASVRLCLAAQQAIEEEKIIKLS